MADGVDAAFCRTGMLIGPEGLATLAQKRVAVFGLGGVGGHLCEALARAGLGALDIFDDDTVAESNLNRQLVALRSTLGQPKAEAMTRRIADISPACKVRPQRVFYMPENAADYPFDAYDYVADAVDTVSAKLEIIARAKAAGIPVISCMGTGNKLHPEALRLADIADTHTCPLARVMRKELKKRGILGLRVLFSVEAPLRPRAACEEPPQPQSARPGEGKKNPPGSVSFVPAAAGLIMAGQIVRDLLGID